MVPTTVRRAGMLWLVVPIPVVWGRVELLGGKYWGCWAGETEHLAAMGKMEGLSGGAGC